MNYLTYSHRFADIIINSDYSIRQEIEKVINDIDTKSIQERYQQDNIILKQNGKKLRKGMQASLNAIFEEKFTLIGWESEKNVFDSRKNDLTIDFWKRFIGIDVAFNHRSFI